MVQWMSQYPVWPRSVPFHRRMWVGIKGECPREGASKPRGDDVQKPCGSLRVLLRKNRSYSCEEAVFQVEGRLRPEALPPR